MPFVFGIIGVLLVVSGVRGQTATLATLVKNDFTGQPNYLEWMFAIFIVGAFGYIPKLAPVSRMFMVLIVVGLFLADHGQTGTGFFSGLVHGIEANPKPASIPQTVATGTNNQGSALNALPALQELYTFNTQQSGTGVSTALD